MRIDHQQPSREKKREQGIASSKWRSMCIKLDKSRLQLYRERGLQVAAEIVRGRLRATRAGE